MRQQCIVGSLIIGLLFNPPASAKTDDWNSVVSIPLGDTVRVRNSRGTVECTLAAVTDIQLTCRRERRFEQTATTYVIPRQEIIEVRRKTPHRLIVATAIGAAIGAGSISYAANDEANSRAEGALGGLVVGGLVGFFGGLFFDHGQIVYKR